MARTQHEMKCYLDGGINAFDSIIKGIETMGEVINRDQLLTSLKLSREDAVAIMHKFMREES